MPFFGAGGNTKIHCYFLLEKCENLLQCKRFSHFSNKKTKDSHIILTKNNSVFVIFKFETLTTC